MPDDSYDELAARLRVTHLRVARLPATDAVKARIVHRLLAVTNLAKRDMARASRRLEALESDLDAGRIDAAADVSADETAE